MKVAAEIGNYEPPFIPYEYRRRPGQAFENNFRVACGHVEAKQAASTRLKANGLFVDAVFQDEETSIRVEIDVDGRIQSFDFDTWDLRFAVFCD